MTRVQIECNTIVSVVGTIASYAIGLTDKILIALFILIVIDYVTGLLAAWYKGKLNSQKGFRGIIKKIMMLIVVVLANQLDVVFGSDVVRTMTILFFIGNEGLSISENAYTVGIPVPGFLKDRLEQLKEQKEEKNNG